MLIILATVSINVVLGEDGLIAQAETARDLYKNSSAVEEEALQELLDEYNDTILGDTEVITVDVADGMIPVVYNSSTGYWEMADTDEEWYDYSASSKQWANVVLSAEEEGSIWTTDENGTTVLDESSNYIQLVYIPRYAYKITSGYHMGGDELAGGAGTIEIVFIDENNCSSTGVEFSTEYPSVTDDSMDDYVVHPAFDFGDTHLAGFWVGKFESSNTNCDSYYNSDGSVNEDFDVTTGEVIEYTGSEIMTVKANVTSWRNISASHAFEYCLSLDDNSNIYGLTEGETDSHMMKNTEWGAVAYLTQSRYGKNSEVWVNSNMYYITGMAGSSVNAMGDYDEDTGYYIGEEETYAYNTSIGVNASTTGNVYGIYDMSAGNEEVVASFLNISGETKGAEDGSGYLQYLYDAAESDETKKYVNVYEASSEDESNRYLNYLLTAPNNGYYGDAMYETSLVEEDGIVTNSWYNANSSYTNADVDALARGGGRIPIMWKLSQIYLHL